MFAIFLATFYTVFEANTPAGIRLLDTHLSQDKIS